MVKKLIHLIFSEEVKNSGGSVSSQLRSEKINTSDKIISPATEKREEGKSEISHSPVCVKISKYVNFTGPLSSIVMKTSEKRARKPDLGPRNLRSRLTSRPAGEI